MNKLSSNYLIYNDKEIVKAIMEKYDIPFLEAYKKFLNSRTYNMLEDKNLEMYEFSALAMFDMWESEMITGTPQNSIYLRSVD